MQHLRNDLPVQRPVGVDLKGMVFSLLVYSCSLFMVFLVLHGFIL